MEKMKVELKVDISDLREKLDAIENDFLKELDPANAGRRTGYVYKQALDRTYIAMRTIAAREMSHEYNMKVRDCKKCFAKESIKQGNRTIGMDMILNDVRGKIGDGKVYPASIAADADALIRDAGKSKRGHRKGARLAAGLLKYYRVETKVLRARRSKLPKNIFMRNNKVYHRMEPSRRIRPAVGIAAPQMAMNRAADEIETRAREVFLDRLAHEAEQALERIRAKKNGSKK